MSIKISIITVCCNSEKHIERAIKSVIEQTYDNVEYIVVDNASTDDTRSIIQKYASHIDHIICEPDNGISDAFNKGIRIASGDLIGVVNSDDELIAPYVLEEVAKYYNPDVDILRGATRTIEANGHICEREPGMNYRSLSGLVFYQSCHMGAFISKAAYEKYGGYDDRYEYLMDIELLYRFHRLGAKEERIPLVIGNMYYGGKTTIRRTPEMTAQIYSEYKGIIDSFPCGRATKCLVAGMIRTKLIARNCIYGRFPSVYRVISKVISK